MEYYSGTHTIKKKAQVPRRYDDDDRRTSFPGYAFHARYFFLRGETPLKQI
jgi:hypothetical protein